MFDPALRRLKDRLLDPLARGLPGVPPLALTGAALVLGLASAYAAWHGRFGLALTLWLGNRVFDGLDGAVARMHGKASDLGGFLDLVADFVVYGTIPAALALRPGAHPALAGAAVVLLVAFYVNTVSWTVASALLEKRARGAAPNPSPTSVTIPEGLVSGGETILFYTLFFLLPEHQLSLFYAMAGLTAITVAQRVAWATSVFRD
ncbi:MAG: CDP-alcohol phosphatidyltransferase family protein [Gemmatimonadota bacterium]